MDGKKEKPKQKTTFGELTTLARLAGRDKQADKYSRLMAPGIETFVDRDWYEKLLSDADKGKASGNIQGQPKSGVAAGTGSDSGAKKSS